MLKQSNKGIVGLIILGIVFLLFVFFVGKRVYDANKNSSMEQANMMASIEII